MSEETKKPESPIPIIIFFAVIAVIVALVIPWAVRLDTRDQEIRRLNEDADTYRAEQNEYLRKLVDEFADCTRADHEEWTKKHCDQRISEHEAAREKLNEKYAELQYRRKKLWPKD